MVVARQRMAELPILLLLLCPPTQVLPGEGEAGRRDVEENMYIYMKRHR